jgi:HSP20 family molecular chaperone IbpA
VKTYAVVEPVAASRTEVRKRRAQTSGRAQRDCITLSDATDCLLEAYDCVARRAYEYFVERGPRPGGELADWLNAERELLLGFTVNVEHSTQFIYAMASIPGATAARIEIGIEARWLVILVQASCPAQVRRDEAVSGVSRSFDLGLAIGRGKSPSAGVDGGRESCVGVSRAIDTRIVEPRVPDSREDDRGPSKSVCILELPASVDAARSIAILSDGLLAIRMPKINSRN